MIELDGVTASLGGRVVLDRITLSVGSEVVVVIGPSGSGKTTLLRVLLGFEAPSVGRVRIGERLASRDGRIDLRPEERNVAMVFQDLALWPHLSVRGNLEFALKARGLRGRERDERIAQALSWVGLASKHARRPDELSGGERQRVAIARALVQEPAALLLDEPLGSLDVALKDELLDVFARLFAERNLPVLYVTHDPHEARRLGHRIVALESGRVVQQGALAELAAQPATPFVRAFVRAARGADD